MTDHFQLIESLLWEPDGGYFLLERHLDRLMASACHFGFAVQRAVAAEQLSRHALCLQAACKVRLLASEDGAITITDSAVAPSTTVRLALDDQPTETASPHVRHKTTRRAHYEAARARHPDVDDVVLYNGHRQITETTSCNLVLGIDGRRLTPALTAGLLPGTFRGHLLACGDIEEAALTVADLVRADALWVINSVRRMRPAVLVRPR